MHGIALAFHKAWMSVTGSDKKEHGIAANLFSVMITFLFTTFCWIFFRAESVADALIVVKRIFSFQRGVEQPYFWFMISFIVMVICILSAYMKSKRTGLQVKKKNTCLVDGYYPILDLNKFWGLVWFFVFCGLILCLAYAGGSPFIYGNY